METKEERIKKQYFVLIVAVLAVLIVGSFAFNEYRLISTRQEIAETNQKIQSSELNEKLKEANDITQKYNAAELSIRQMAAVNLFMKSRDMITTKLLNSISNCMPQQDMNFTQVNIDQNTISITASTKQRPNIAALEYNLRNLKLGSDVYIGAINGNNGAYSFQIQYTLNTANKAKEVDKK